MFVARLKVLLAVKPIKQAIDVVAFHIAFSVSEHIPTFYGSCAVHPRVDP